MKLSLTFGALALFLAVVSAGKGGQKDNNNNEGDIGGFVNNFFESGFLTKNGKSYVKATKPAKQGKGH